MKTIYLKRDYSTGDPHIAAWASRSGDTNLTNLDIGISTSSRFSSRVPRSAIVSLHQMLSEVLSDWPETT